MKRTRYTVKYRCKKDYHIEERIRWSIEEADKLKHELQSIDYIEYLGTDVLEEETNEIKIENVLKNQVAHVIDLYDGLILQQKMYDLAFEWYMKGFTRGMETEREFHEKSVQ